MVKELPTLQRKLNKAANFNRRKNIRLVNWNNATWQIDGSGRAYNTPTMGGELLTNTEFANNTTGWTAANTATLTRRDFASSPNIAPTGGADNFGLEVTSGGNTNSLALQNVTLLNGSWYFAGVRAYSPSANTGTNVADLRVVQPNTITPNANTLENTWQPVIATGRATSTVGDFRLRASSATAGDLAYFDAPSLKVIVLPTTLATVAGSTNNLTVAAKINTIITGTQIGVASLIDNYNNPQNFIIAYHDGINVRLEKCVSGVYTQLISTAVTFVSNAQIEIRRPSGNTFQLWYNGVQINTDQTVSDSEIINNNLYGMFSTYSDNLISEFSLGGSVIPFTF